MAHWIKLDHKYMGENIISTETKTKIFDKILQFSLTRRLCAGLLSARAMNQNKENNCW